MAKRVVKVTRKGIVDEGTVGSVDLPNEADFTVDSESTLVEDGGKVVTSRAVVGASTTGSITNKQQWVFATGPAQVNLPSNPVDGQLHRVIAFGGGAVWVSGSGVSIARPVGGPPAAEDIFSGSAVYREYYYEGQTPIWVSLASSKY